jgi:hypothetical protein
MGKSLPNFEITKLEGKKKLVKKNEVLQPALPLEHIFASL